MIPAGTLAEARFNTTATRLPDGRVLVIGGDVFDVKQNVIPLVSAEIWDPMTMSFTPAGALQDAANLAGVAVLQDGRVLVIEQSGAAEIWHP